MADPSPYVSRLQCVVHLEGGAATLLSIGKRAAPRCESRAVPPLLCRHVVCGDAQLTLPPTSQASDPVARPRVRSVDGAAEGEAARRRHRVPRFGRDLAEIRLWGGGDVVEVWRVWRRDRRE